MKENPYTSPDTTADLVAADQPKTLQGRGFEIAHNVFRGLLAFIFIGLLPVFIVPQLKDMFDEFGISFPLLFGYVAQFSGLVARLWYVYLPLSFFVFASIEFGLFNFPRGKWKTLINVAYWLMLVLVIGSACLSALRALISITTGLTGA